MLGLSHSAAFRGLLLAGAVALHACALPPERTAPDGRPLPRSFCTIRLSAENEKILIARVVGRDTTLQQLGNVLEVGGRVVATWGDTLVLEPYYLTTRTDRQPPTIFRGRATAMPDLVLLRMTPGVSLREYRTPATARSARLTFTVLLGSALLLTLLASDVALLFSL